MIQKTVLSIIFIIWLVVINAQSTIFVIPRPVDVKLQQGKSTSINNKTILYYPVKYREQAYYLKSEIEKQTGIVLQLQIFENPSKRPAWGILLVEEAVKINRAEMYKLEVDVTLALNRIVLSAKDVRGFVNGIQTLLQLIPIKQQASITVPAVSIIDYPQFSYRGMHLDVVRHIFPVDYIKKYIDYLTFHKFNTFHWHLTDDQGWRFETSSYPKLNSIASWRDSTLIGHFKTVPAKYDGKRYGGYYTKAEIKEILEYAKVRGITVIPELDIPGHSRAAIAAYPQLSTKPDTVWNVATTWGMYNRQNNVLAPNDFTFQFLKDIFKELADLFPSTYIHIGGDECSKLWWKQDAKTQQFIKQKNLKDEVALQTYFIEYVAKQLKHMNRKTVGWHEITEGEVDTSALIMNWADDAKALSAAKKGYSIIMTPGKPFYFDHYQSKDPNDSLAIHGYNPTEAVYNYQIVPDALKKAGLAHKIIGGQGNVWTEYMEWSTKVDYMIFPRMTALSENLWSKTKNYNDFLKRLEMVMIPRYEFWNSSYFTKYRDWKIEK
jgi:hexosaminidase